MKHTATVAKVVNPLGTVVTVQSDEDIEVEPTEEIIHENCDEALFRPIVTSKAIVFAEPSKKSKSKIINSQSEVDSGIEKERSQSPIITSSQQESHNKSLQTNSNYPKNKIICDISDTFADMQFVPLTEPKRQPFNIITPPPLEKLEFPRRSQSPEEQLIMLKTPDEDLKCGNKKERRTKNDRYQGLDQKDIVSSSEENATEEKNMQKKPRKPKTKLGVRIININKDNDEQKDDISVDFHIALPKKSWSSIAASKPTSKIDLEQNASSNISEPSAFKQSILETQSPPSEILSNILEPQKVQYEQISTIKIEKSSDEEKVESSQTETTESDDSSKVPVEPVAMDTEEDTCQLETVKMVASKINKKKSKKKRK